MAELTETGSRWERILASTSGRSLVMAFWAAFVVAWLAAALPTPVSAVLGGVAQLVLAMIWIGYPIALLYCFAEHKVRIVGVPLVACGAVAGYVLSVFVYDKNGEVARSTVAPLLGALLILTPFVLGAYALKEGEKKAKMMSTANVAVTALALFALPFFGASVQERFCRAQSSLRGTPR